MTDWKPIETAPKEDDHLLLLGYAPQLGVRIMRYSGWGGGTGHFETESKSVDGYHFWDEFPATHWMPLPQPPSEGGG